MAAHDDQYLAVLAAADHPERTEWPEGFNFRAEWQRFTQLADAIDGALGIPCQRDGETSVQDASYLGEVTLPDETLAIPIEPIRTYSHIYPQHATVAVSNWGSLATVFRADHVKPEVLQTLQRLLEEHGYVYIPERILLLPYTGPNPHLPEGRLWLNRYFDFF